MASQVKTGSVLIVGNMRLPGGSRLDRTVRSIGRNWAIDPTEMKEQKARVEDAMHLSKAAVEGGQKRYHTPRHR